MTSITKGFQGLMHITPVEPWALFVGVELLEYFLMKIEAGEITWTY